MRGLAAKLRSLSWSLISRSDRFMNRLYSSRFNPLYHSGALVVLLLVVLLVTGLLPPHLLPDRGAPRVGGPHHGSGLARSLDPFPAPLRIRRRRLRRRDPRRPPLRAGPELGTAHARVVERSRSPVRAARERMDRLRDGLGRPGAAPGDRRCAMVGRASDLLGAPRTSLCGRAGHPERLLLPQSLPSRPHCRWGCS